MSAKRSTILAVAGASALAAFLYSCNFTATAEAGENTPFSGSKLSINVDGRRVTPEPDSGGGYPQPGDCVKLHFKDGAGNEIGSAEVSAGESADAPEGTESVTWSPCDPKEDPEPKKTRRTEPVQQFVADELLVVPYRSLPLDLSDGHGRYLDYLVTAPGFYDAEDVAREFERDLLSHPRPAQVRTYGFADIELLSDGRVRFSVLSWCAPRSFELHFNGTLVADELTEAQVTQTAGGWYATTAFVPESLVRYALPGAEAANDAWYDVVTSEGDVSATLSLVVRP